MANSAKSKNKPVTQPFLGLFYDRPSYQVDPKALVDCNNVRIHNGRITSFQMGWSLFLPAGVVLNGPVTLIDLFQFSNGTQVLILGSPTDLYQYINGAIFYITPQYTTGTIAVSVAGVVTGSGTAWNTAIASGYRNNARAGDQIYIGSTGQNATNPSGSNGGWWTVASVASDTSLTLANYTGGTVAGGTAYTLRQAFAGDAQTHHWNSETFPNAGAPDNSDLWFAVNGADCLFKWNGQTVAGSYVSTMPFVAFELRRFKNMMIYGGLIETSGVFAPSSIANSDNNLPTSMNTGVAGQFVVTDDALFINDLEIFGNSLIIFAGNNLRGDVIGAQFIGLPLLWSFTEVIRNRGPIASRLVVSFPDHIQFVAADGEYRYNGLFVQLMNTQVWRFVLQSFDLSRADRAFAIVNKQFGDVIWALPLTSDTNSPGINTAYVEHYLEQANQFLFKPITKRDFPMTAGGFFPQIGTLTWNQITKPFNTQQIPFNFSGLSGSYPLCLVGDVNGLVYVLYNGDTQNGAAFTSFAQFPQRFTVNERSRGLVKRVYPFIEVVQNSSYNIAVTLTMYDQVGGMTAITDVQQLNPGYAGNRFTTHYRRGRLAAVKFSTTGPSQPWALDGYDIDAVAGGLR